MYRSIHSGTLCNDESKHGVFPDSDHGRANSRSHAMARSKLSAARRSPDASTQPSKIAAEAKPTRKPPTTRESRGAHACPGSMHACAACVLLPCMQLRAPQHPRAEMHQVNIFDDFRYYTGWHHCIFCVDSCNKFYDYIGHVVYTELHRAEHINELYDYVITKIFIKLRHL